jgi:hypothetical protein
MEGVFTLYNFVGQPVSYWKVRKIELPLPKIEKTLGHHIVVLDRSGSMYGEMDTTKAMVEKVFTVEEFKNSNILLTLISYSSQGDVTVHFSRTPVEDVMKANSAELQALRSIQASCYTCASQGLEAAIPFIQDETTAISLHTDGWFNDASPASEKKAIDKILKELSKRPNVMINTIAYRSYSDFNMLTSIANKMSGACVLANNLKDLYDALHNTTALVAGRTAPAIPLNIDGADWQLAINFTKRKVNGAATDIMIRGMEEEDDLHVYRFSSISKSTYAGSGLPSLDKMGLPGIKVLAAFAKTKLAEGKINDAKFAMVTMRDPAFLSKHYRALSSAQLSSFSQDLDALMASDVLGSQSPTYGFDAERPTLKQLFELLEANREKFTLHMPEFLKTYQKRGIKRLEGSWTEGNFIPTTVGLVPEVDYDTDPSVEVTGFDINKAEATINMGIRRDATITKDGKPLSRIGGKKLSVPLLRSYTVVGDGQPNVDVLPIFISEKVLFDQLSALGYITHNSAITTGSNVGISGYDHRTVYAIQLNDFPVIPMVATDLTVPSSEELEHYASNLMTQKIIEALLPKEENSDIQWTPEQIEELRSVHLTPNLAFSPPSANPYTDLEDAVRKGWLDSYTRYSVSFGTPLATDLRTSLWSANEYLARKFEITLNGEKQKKPKLLQLREPNAVISPKTSSRTVPSPLDTFVYAIFESVLITTPIQDWPTEKLREYSKSLSNPIQATEAKISQLALALGSTGLIPDEWNAEILTAEKLREAYPGMDIPKSCSDMTFYRIGPTIIGVSEEVAWYSTPAGVEEAARLSTI